MPKLDNRQASTMRSRGDLEKVSDVPLHMGPKTDDLDDFAAQ